jgi:rhodanese-related sulfurtransferase
VLAFGIACGQAEKTPSKTITTEELTRLLEQPGKVFFLDVREPGEIERLGSVKGYVNIPMSQLERRLNEVPKDKLIVTL